ncbi:MAG: type II secretion system protein GspG [Candidatus Hydrogenedentes bacterium]|nr:type II secretion system protein GspG [Candidatus Hydrogenedentota bacterium]
MKKSLTGCVTATLLVIAAAMAVLLVPAWLRSPDDPLARMFRTEADLTALSHAVDVYREQEGAYPPPGLDGLERAAAALSRNMDYFAKGPPRDAWDLPYIYVPATEYANETRKALKDGAGGWFAPDTFQLYSTGADGEAGLTNPEAQRDNITSWDKTKSWRKIYRNLPRD